MHFRLVIRRGQALVALAAIVAGLWLGNFEHHRAEQRQAAYDRVEALKNAAPVSVGAAPLDPVKLNYHPVVVRGTWRVDKTIFLDNKVYRKTVGYEVVTPLQIAGTSICVLVDRGWIAAPPLRSELPAMYAPQGEVKVIGVARPPHLRMLQLGPDQASGRVWENLSLARFHRWSGLELQTILILQTNDAPDGLVRDWHAPGTLAGINRGFSVIWYLMAAAATVLLFKSLFESYDGER